ncbi:MAG: hypothetical protein R3Y06_09125 [Faecalibacterium sp.]
MSYETMMYIGIGVSIVLFVLAVILFIQLNIPRVIGGLTGYSARKEIASIREQNAQSGKKGYQTSPINRARGKITTPLAEKGKIDTFKKAPSAELSRIINQTEALAQGSAQQADFPTDGTTLLSADTGATTVLGEAQAGATTMLGDIQMGETTMLGTAPVCEPLPYMQAQAGETAQLGTPQAPPPGNPQASLTFIIEVDQVVTHTNEQID